jgi:hypothetical protein
MDGALRLQRVAVHGPDCCGCAAAGPRAPLAAQDTSSFSRSRWHCGWLLKRGCRHCAFMQ